MKNFPLLFSLLCFLIGSAHAAEPFSDQLVQTPSLAKPKRGSLKGDFAELGEKALNPSTGSFSVSLPINFPSERGGMQQSYAVSYSPGFGISEFGVGWNAGLKISRMKEIGKIDFSTDDFMTPFGQMVEGSDGYYYSKDLRKKVRAELNGHEFTFYLPNGDVAIFGQASTENYNDIHENSAVYTWYLRETFDQVGQKTQYSYQRFDVNGRLYLTEISYGGLGTDFQYRIDFAYEEVHRPFLDHSLGRIQISNSRVLQISLKSNEGGNFQERYHYDFNYEGGEESPGFYLTSMQKVYAGGATEPFVTFNYDKPRDFLLGTTWQVDSSLDGISSLYNGIATLYAQTSTVDFNLDGRPDLEIGPGYNRFIRTDTGFEEYTPPAATGEISKWCLFPVEQSRKPRKFLQFLGPNTDQMVYEKFEFNGQTFLEVCEVNGERIDTLQFPKGWHDNGTTIFHDVDGDLLPDLIHLNGKQIQFAYNTSSGGEIHFSAPTSPTYINLPSYFYGFWVKDMNGDGQEDLVLKGDSAIYVHYGIAGGGFATDFVFFSFYLPSGSVNSRNIKEASILWVDANKDSLPDVLMQFDGLFSLHLNSGALFTQINVPGLFAGNQLYNNTMVADLGAIGGTQLVSSVRAGSSYSIQALDLDRPSLGLLTSVDDGKGNSTSFEFVKSNAEVGVPNRKTVVSKITRKSTGESDYEQAINYASIATHSLTQSFLGFQDVNVVTTGLGESTTTFAYDAQDLQKTETTEVYDLARAGFRKFSVNSYTDFTLAGVTSPFLTQVESGHSDATGSVTNSTTTVNTISSSTLCQTQSVQTGNSLNLTTTTVYDNLVNFSDHLACLSKDQTISATGVEGFSHEIHFTRDPQGRVTKVEQGTAGSTTTVQDITYGSNGRLATIDNAASGLTSVIYDANYRITEITNPDSTQNRITSFEFLNDQPEAMQTERDSQSYVSSFRFDGLGRLNKQWDDLVNFSETTPQFSLVYDFATATKPGKIYQVSNIEKTVNNFGSNEDVALETARGQELASIMETATNLKVSGLKEYDSQNLITKAFQDHLISLSTDLEALETSDLDFSQTQIMEEEKELLGGMLGMTQAVQVGVDTETDVDKVVLGNGVETETTLNNDLNLVTKTLSNEFGHTTKYTDQIGSEYLYDRDSLGRIKKITFPDGIVQTIQYESRFGKISEISRDHIGKITYEYDPVTTLLNKKSVYDKNDILDRTVDFTYDHVGRVTQKKFTQYNLDTTVKEVIDYDYTYDGANLPAADQPGQQGFLTGVESPIYEKSMVYRLDGKVLRQEVLIPGDMRFTTEFTYNSQGEVSSKREIVYDVGASNEKVNYLLSYEFDRFGNVVEVKKDGTSFATLTYNDFNELEKVFVTGGKEITHLYDSRTRRLVDYEEKTPTKTLLRQVLGFNNRGLIATSDMTLKDRFLANTYTYTSRGFLASQIQTQTLASDSYEYNYDESGNSIYYGTLTSHKKNAQNFKDVQVTATTWSTSGINYEVDDLGRVTKRGTRKYTYGPTGRIQESRSGNTLKGIYYYDEENMPIAKKTPVNIREVYLGDNLWRTGNFFEPIKVGSRVIGYFKDGTFKATSQNHLNTYVVNKTEAYKESGPYGERNLHTSEENDIMDFALKGFDTNLQAVRMGRRYYDSVAKRFLTPDMFFFEQPEKIVGSPIQGGLYGYVGNDPVNNLDPTGDCFENCGDIPAVSAEVGAAVATTAATMIPGVGEAMDAAVIADPNSSALEKGIAGVSLGANALTGGALPNVGGAILGVKTAKEMASDLASKIGKNSVSFKTPNKVGHIDLRGKAHFDKKAGAKIETPHVQTKTLNTGPNGKVSASNEVTRPATKQDVRTARELVKRRGQ